MVTQNRNDELVDLLSADFAMRNEPNVAWGNVISNLLLLPGVRAVWPMSVEVDVADAPFGSMYIPGVDIVVLIGVPTPIEVKNVISEGWAAGELNSVTFPTGGPEHHLILTTPGRYEILWNMSLHTNMGGKTEVHGGIMIDNVATRNNGESHRTVSNTQDSGAFSGVCIANLPNGNEEISLWVINDLSNDLHVAHGTVTIKFIGAT